MELTPTQIDHFHKEGYLLVKGLYAKADLDRIRSLIAETRASGKWDESEFSTENRMTNIYGHLPELIDMIYTPPHIKIMKQLLGEHSVLVPQPTIHRNVYFNWHKDSNFLETTGESLQWESRFCAAQTALYLQDNHPEHGGGLSVIPGSQQRRDKYLNPDRLSPFDRIILKVRKALRISSLDQLDRDKTTVHIPSKAGDLIIFHLNLNHKGTGRNTGETGRDKYSIVNVFFNDPVFAEAYTNALARIGGGYELVYRSQKENLPTALIRKGEELGIRITI